MQKIKNSKNTNDFENSNDENTNIFKNKKQQNLKE